MPFLCCLFIALNELLWCIDSIERSFLQASDFELSFSRMLFKTVCHLAINMYFRPLFYQAMQAPSSIKSAHLVLELL